MDKILFGDNQFFAVNHMSDEKARAQAIRFKDNSAILNLLDYVYDIGIRTFMCTTHDRIGDICDVIRANPNRYDGFKLYPCMPYAHKYNNAVAEMGILGALKKMMPGSLLGTMARGGVALAMQDYIGIMKLLVDAEMKMFKGINTGVIFLQNVVTDLMLGLGTNDFFTAFAEYVKKEYRTEPGFITMNLPMLGSTLENCGIENPIICASINKIGFRMSGGKYRYEEVIASNRCRVIAMQPLAAGAIPPKEAIEYVCGLKGISSILFGASTKAHIVETKETIESFWAK
ncbi:hypothetical protein DSCO28_18620 [Desulfosarcina ovata subsp. sediminis]|uniref:Uncharacterized protein n=1 Tax=Desulfosarcina ovata subsp. sediminis TaxID=885957 RepID=A0A5K7ZJU4_9BACT|nr:hypothetical protein [Desulfosarcina ovata]BBO81296.1 hypothetical protein DSCO28_18620 [Desulfosarcina ovata subsp. sediminis]